MISHTHGNWTAQPSENGPGFVVRTGDEHLPVAIAPVNLRGRAEAMANALLIAAAPEMLAALTKTRDNLSGLSRSDDDVYAAMVRRLDAAIAKATTAPVDLEAVADARP